MAHKQIFVKVNVEVDEGIAPVVSALSLFPELWTLGSCQGFFNKDGSERKAANVFFMYGHNKPHSWKSAAEFVFGFLAPKLIELVDDDASIAMELGYGYQATFTLRIRPTAIKGTAEAIRRVYALWIEESSAVSLGQDVAVVA